MLAADSATDVPTIAASRATNNVLIEFKATWQSDDALTGPRLDLVDAGNSPVLVPPSGVRIYRARTAR